MVNRVSGNISYFIASFQVKRKANKIREPSKSPTRRIKTVAPMHGYQLPSDYG